MKDYKIIRIVRKYAKLYENALDSQCIPQAHAKTRRYRSRLYHMLTSEAYHRHNIYPTINVRHVYAVIAMCLELRKTGMSDADIISFMNIAFARRKDFFAKIIALIDVLPFSYGIVKAWNLDDHAKRVKDHSITYDVFQVKDDKIEYSISKCMYVEMFEYYGIKELCKIFCNTDIQAYANLRRHVRFIRHSDLSNGDSCHDEVFRRKKRRYGRKTPEQYKSLTVSEFTRAADVYETGHAGIYEMCKDDYPYIEAELSRMNYHDLLDCGCGTGPMISLLHEKDDTKHYTGLDLTPKMIEVAKSKNLSNTEFVVGDCENLPFEDESFDVIICTNSFHHYPDPQKFFDSAVRVLRPGGKLILQDYTAPKLILWFMNHTEMPLANLIGHGDVRAYSLDEIREFCKNSGLKVEKLEAAKKFRMHLVAGK